MVYLSDADDDFEDHVVPAYRILPQREIGFLDCDLNILEANAISRTEGWRLGLLFVVILICREL